MSENNDEKRNLGEELIKGLQEIIDGKAARVTEAAIIECKVCKVMKSRFEAGKFPNGKIKKYVDQFGAAWNGKVCSTCNRERMKKVMQSNRLGKNATEV